MNLPFFTKLLIRSAQLSLGLVETFSYEREVVWFIDKVCYNATGEDNNTCISCAFHGYKYMLEFIKERKYKCIMHQHTVKVQRKLVGICQFHAQYTKMPII